MADPTLTPQQRAAQQMKSIGNSVLSFLPNFAQAQASTMPAAPPAAVAAPVVKPALPAISPASGDWTPVAKPAFPATPVAPALAAAPVLAPPPAPAAGTPAAFAATYGPTAQRISAATGVDANVILAQLGHETGWGKSVIPGTNNLGNIKDFSGAGTSATDNMTGSTDKYMKFADTNAFADHYASLLQRRYPEAIGTGNDAAAFAGALAARGYAQDPNYATKIQGAYGTLTGTPAATGTASPATQGLPVLSAAPRQSSRVALQSPHYLDEHGNEDVFRTAQGHQIIYTGQGPMVDGVLTPHSVIAAGMVPQFLQASSQGSVTDADKTSVANAQATSLEAQKAASAGNVAGIGASANRYAADQALEGHKATIAEQRYEAQTGSVPLGTTVGVDPTTHLGIPLTTYGQRPAAVGGMPTPYNAEPATPAPPAAVKYLQEHPETAATFRAKYGYLPKGK